MVWLRYGTLEPPFTGKLRTHLTIAKYLNTSRFTVKSMLLRFKSTNYDLKEFLVDGRTAMKGTRSILPESV